MKLSAASVETLQRLDCADLSLSFLHRHGLHHGYQMGSQQSTGKPLPALLRRCRHRAFSKAAAGCAAAGLCPGRPRVASFHKFAGQRSCNVSLQLPLCSARSVMRPQVRTRLAILGSASRGCSSLLHLGAHSEAGRGRIPPCALFWGFFGRLFAGVRLSRAAPQVPSSRCL